MVGGGPLGDPFPPKPFHDPTGAFPEGAQLDAGSRCSRSFAPLPSQPWSAPAAGADIPAPADSWEEGSEAASAWEREWAAEHSDSPLGAPPSPTPSPAPRPAGEASGSNSKDGARHSQHPREGNHGKKSLGAFCRMNWLQNSCSAEALPLPCPGLILHSWS